MYSTTITPRVSETDGVGHINNTTIPVWLEAGRKEIFKLFNPDLAFHDWRCILLKIDIQYVSEIHYHSDVVVNIWVEKVGNTSFTLYEEIHQNDHCCTKGHAVYVNVARKGGKQTIPNEIKLKLMEHSR
ncbi:thioesterase family protein [Geomicrobium sp. JCM 19038]|uniref:acyl-CoA thioesterase n=1 Tax=Geomicrobium sp. JCM 19038 TaxID=1460635 RepID=UPI00045F3D79|nr:thioesterase family protein [Geomicrobium sp. JCM 19038]GAK07917.1 hypothetical protein JCM19038_1671 [Geomicrobium sp. JCM 19038]